MVGAQDTRAHRATPNLELLHRDLSLPSSPVVWNSKERERKSTTFSWSLVHSFILRSGWTYSVQPLWHISIKRGNFLESDLWRFMTSSVNEKNKRYFLLTGHVDVQYVDVRNYSVVLILCLTTARPPPEIQHLMSMGLMRLSHNAGWWWLG